MFLEKISVAIISSGVLALILMIDYLSGFEDIGWSFVPWFIIYFIYAAPVYLIGGGLYSAFGDLFISSDRFQNKYLYYAVGFVVYAFGGIVIMALYMMFVFYEGNYTWSEVFSGSLFGVVAALIFYHILLGWRKMRENVA